MPKSTSALTTTLPRLPYPHTRASYASTCPVCSLSITLGTTVYKIPRGWVDEACARAHFALTTSATATPMLAQWTCPCHVAANTPPIPRSVADACPVCSSSALDILFPGWFKPSTYQHAIYTFLLSATGHAVVEAVAGSGKTTTIVQALLLTAPSAAVAFVAFNKHIARELRTKAPKHVHVSTLHSLGLRNLRNRYKHLRTDTAIDDHKFDRFLDKHFPLPRLDPHAALTDTPISAAHADAALLDYQNRRTIAIGRRDALRQLVSFAKATLVNASDRAAVMNMVAYYNIDLLDSVTTDKLITLLPVALNWCAANIATVDFDDMLWLCVRLNLPLQQFDWLFVDEAQDLNACEIEFVIRSVTPRGRIIAVGDRYQSLYGFRGAGINAIPELIQRLHATALPLSITYRCPTQHVYLARLLVPHLEAAPHAHIGTIDHILADAFATRVLAGDMVLCRINAPLVGYALQLIAQGIKAVVRGRDIGAGLCALAERLGERAEMLDATLHPRDGRHPMTAMYLALDEYHDHEEARLVAAAAKPAQFSMLEDKVDSLKAVMGRCDTPAEVVKRIDAMFSDDVEGVVLSSVHKAKGLEANRVWIVEPQLMPFPKVSQDWERQQEDNIKYVALTRSKDALIFVHKTPEQLDAYEEEMEEDLNDTTAEGGEKEESQPITTTTTEAVAVTDTIA